MTDKELQDFTKCMEATAYYNAHGLSVIAEAYLMRADALSANRGH